LNSEIPIFAFQSASNGGKPGIDIEFKHKSSLVPLIYLTPEENNGCC
jgi:hypothetical protein